MYVCIVQFMQHGDLTIEYTRISHAKIFFFLFFFLLNVGTVQQKIFTNHIDFLMSIFINFSKQFSIYNKIHTVLTVILIFLKLYSYEVVLAKTN